MSAFLAIDGGNSKTDVLIGTSAGEVLAFARGAGTCYQNIGLAAALARLRALVAEARTAAGLAPDAVFERADIFLAGADLPEEIDLLSAAVAGQGWSGQLRLENDTFALLRAGTDALDAVAVVCGAGINCVGRSASGRTARFPSLGRLSGDWGGGGQLATLALWHAVRGDDGRGPATALSAAVADHFGLSSAEEVSARLHLGSLDDVAPTVATLDVARLAELTPVLFRIAEAGDPVARGVIAQQAAEVVALATVAARRLDLLDSPFTLVLGGGVLRAQHPLLLAPIVEQVRVAAPKVSIAVVTEPPVLGAALAALDALSAPSDAYQRLRQTVTRG